MAFEKLTMLHSLDLSDNRAESLSSCKRCDLRLLCVSFLIVEYGFFVEFSVWQADAVEGIEHRKQQVCLATCAAHKQTNKQTNNKPTNK